MERSILCLVAIGIVYATGVHVGPGLADGSALELRGGPVVCDTIGVDQANCPGYPRCTATYSVCLNPSGTEVPSAKSFYLNNSSCIDEDTDCTFVVPDCAAHGDCEPPGSGS
jgi:hypothetical protein